MTKSEVRSPKPVGLRVPHRPAECLLDRARDWVQNLTAGGSSDSSFGFHSSFVICHWSFAFGFLLAPPYVGFDSPKRRWISARRSFKRTGLVRYSSAPAARQRS